MCVGCDSAGAGKCDPGKCRYGPSKDPAIAVCNYKCCIEVQTFQGVGNYPKATIINSATSEVYGLPITLAKVAFWLDITTCLPGEYFETNTLVGTKPETNIWANNVNMKGNIIVDMISGSATNATFVGVEFIKGDGSVDPYFPIHAQLIKSVKFCVTGYKQDNTTSVISDVSVIYWP
jgi:hypothetical protein